jgi:hypothetical protein
MWKHSAIDLPLSLLLFRATDSRNGYAEAALTVTINNINDAPVFTAASYSGNVDENKASGSTVTFSTAIAASDEDSGDTLTYALTGMCSYFHRG